MNNFNKLTQAILKKTSTSELISILENKELDSDDATGPLSKKDVIKELMNRLDIRQFDSLEKFKEAIKPYRSVVLDIGDKKIKI